MMVLGVKEDRESPELKHSIPATLVTGSSGPCRRVDTDDRFLNWARSDLDRDGRRRAVKDSFVTPDYINGVFFFLPSAAACVLITCAAAAAAAAQPVLLSRGIRRTE